MEQESKKRIALLVDYDNFNQDDYFKVLFDELDEMGDIIIGRVYFSNEEGKKLSDKFRDLELDPIYQLRFSKGKNAVDIRMSIEAIELLNKDYINAFCLATHDSDFTPLVKKLKESNKYVIGAGRDNVSKHFKSACDHFINVEQIHNSKLSADEDNDFKISEINKSINERIRELVKLIDVIIEQNNDEDGTSYLSKVSEQIYLKNKEFNPKNYGATNNKILPFFQKQLKNYYEMISENKTWKIKIKPRNNGKNNKVKSNSMKENAISIIDEYYANNKIANIQKMQQEIKRQIPNFTLKRIGHKKYINFLNELNYEMIDSNNFKKKD